MNRINTVVRNKAASYWLLRRYHRLCRSLERKSRWLKLPLVEIGLYAYTMYSGGVYLTIRLGRSGRKEHAFDALLLVQLDWDVWEHPGGMIAKTSLTLSRWGVYYDVWKTLSKDRREGIKAERNVPYTP